MQGLGVALRILVLDISIQRGKGDVSLPSADIITKGGELVSDTPGWADGVSDTSSPLPFRMLLRGYERNAKC